MELLLISEISEISTCFGDLEDLGEVAVLMNVTNRCCCSYYCGVSSFTQSFSVFACLPPLGVLAKVSTPAFMDGVVNLWYSWRNCRPRSCTPKLIHPSEVMLCKNQRLKCTLYVRTTFESFPHHSSCLP